MHILLIHQVFAAPTEPGGTRHYELARHWVERGHQFTVVASNLVYNTGQQVGARRKFVSEQNLDGVRVLRAYTFPSLNWSFIWRVVAFFSFMASSVIAGLRAGRIDAVMGTSPPIFQAISAWLVALLRRRPFLLEIRDLWPEFAIDIGVLRNPILIAMSRWLERFLYARADHLLVNSPAYRDYLIGKGVPASKVSLISNGVDPDMFAPGEKGQRIRDEFNLDNRFVATYAGAFGMANDLETVLRAADRLRAAPHIHFLMVGGGKEQANLEAMARRLELPNVIFAGSRPKSEMPEVLAASDVCLATLRNIPMFRTTYPNKVFDYMAAERPTILAIDGVIRHVIESANGGLFVPPGDDSALAAAIQRLADDRATARTMGRAARAYVVEHFNRHQQAEDFVNLMEKFARSK